MVLTILWLFCILRITRIGNFHSTKSTYNSAKVERKDVYDIKIPVKIPNNEYILNMIVSPQSTTNVNKGKNAKTLHCRPIQSPK
jgi:hypothetical protein